MIKNFIRYIPAFDGNRQKETPIIVEIHPLSHGEIAGYAKLIHNRMAKDAPDQVVDNASDVQERQFIECVGRIENLVHPFTREPITTAKDLYAAPGYFPLCKEILKAMENISILSEGLIKNSEPPPAGA